MPEETVSADLLAQVEAILGPATNFDARFVEDYGRLAEIARYLKSRGKKIVMTKGVYDLIHVGHARYIDEAKRHGDVLIISIDTDALTRKRKGDNRPIVSQDERLEMIVHLRSADIVTLRDIHHGEEEDIDVVRPDILITSATTADYTDTKKAWLKEMYGLEVVTLQAQAQTSTTARIRTLMIDGAEVLGRNIRELIEGFLEKLRVS